MAKDKDKQINPAAAARKAEKAKALKKGKAAVAQQRNERLAKRNPHTIQAQIDDLKALEANHSINVREKKQLDDLERELQRIIKAKEAAGEKYVPRTHQASDNSSSVLGKRSRNEEQTNRRRRLQSPQSSDTDSDVADIPMPKDSPPPLPRRRREERPVETQDGERPQHTLPEKPVQIQSQAVYESKPVLRDLRKEAVAFVPAAVRNKKVEGGEGGESMPAAVKDESVVISNVGDVVEDDPDRVVVELQRLQEEEERWRMETKQVTVEEVEDEDA